MHQYPLVSTPENTAHNPLHHTAETLEPLVPCTDRPPSILTQYDKRNKKSPAKGKERTGNTRQHATRFRKGKIVKNREKREKQSDIEGEKWDYM